MEKLDKLIELLNEYDEWWNWRKLHWKGLWCEDYDTIWYKDKELTCEQDEIIIYLISKPYWFIKWLVDNNKIDLWKLIMIKDEEQKTIVDIDNSRENTLLMLLAIQDEPIEFLCDILK